MTELAEMSDLTAILGQAVRRGARTAMRKSRQDLKKILEENAPFDEDWRNRKRGAHLKDQIDVRVSFENPDGRTILAGETDTVQLEVRMPGYARFTELGTRRHVITPRSGPYLSFFVGADRIFARSVMHPGTPATGWVTQSVEEWRELLLELITEMDSQDEGLFDDTYTYRLN